MTDDDKLKRILSEPPPTTDEIDEEWGSSPQAPEAVTKSQPVPSTAAVGETAVAPVSAAAKSSEPPAGKTAPVAKAPAPKEDDDDDDDDEEEEDDEEEDDDDDDEEEEDEDDDEPEASAQPAVRPRASGAASDWIPDWGPFAVLGLLVSASILVGLGIVGGPPAPVEEEATPAPSAKPAASALRLKKAPTRPSPHP
jgi:hypothetical protein